MKKFNGLYFIFLCFIFLAPNLCANFPTLSTEDYIEIFVNEGKDKISKGHTFTFNKDGQEYIGQFLSPGLRPNNDQRNKITVKSQIYPKRALYTVIHGPGVTYGQFMLAKEANNLMLHNPQLQSPEEIDKFERNLLKRINLAEQSKKFVYNNLIIGDLTSEWIGRSEKENPANTIDLGTKSIVNIIDSQLYKNGKTYTTAELDKENLDAIWVLDKNENLYIAPYIDRERGTNLQHSFFVKDTEGVGLPIAAGGHIKVNEKGKISYIDNMSGHYQPNKDQFLLAVFALYKKNILDENVIIKNVTDQSMYALDMIKNLDIESILNSYR